MSASKYKSEYCEMLIKHMKQGYSYETFCAEINVGRTTLYDWEKQHQEWKEAKQLAMAEAQKFFEQRLIAKIAGQKLTNADAKLIDTACLIFALKTRFHKTYGEKQDITSNGESIGISFGKDPS